MAAWRRGAEERPGAERHSSPVDRHPVGGGRGRRPGRRRAAPMAGAEGERVQANHQRRRDEGSDRDGRRAAVLLQELRHRALDWPGGRQWRRAGARAHAFAVFQALRYGSGRCKFAGGGDRHLRGRSAVERTHSGWVRTAHRRPGSVFSGVVAGRRTDCLHQKRRPVRGPERWRRRAESGDRAGNERCAGVVARRQANPFHGVRRAAPRAEPVGGVRGTWRGASSL